MFSIGHVKVTSPLILAPMAGITDLPFRLLNRSFGCGLAFTEMISASSMIHGSKNTLRMLSTAPEDRPLGIQILGHDSETIKRSLEMISGYAFDVLDFNAACPVKKVVSKGGGAGLLKEPAKFQEILKGMVENVTVPVTVKLRAGWDETSVNAVEMALRAEEAGAKAVFIHGRTRMQKYSGRVDYDIIREVKKGLKIPVIASGDALTPELVKKLFDETGCDGVAVARGSLGNPWIFRQTAEYLETGQMPPIPDVSEMTATMRRHLALNMAFHGEKIGVTLFRKFFAYYTRGMPLKTLKESAARSATPDEMLRFIDEVESNHSLP
jgi:tRNA-dihydrouridine synthase B